MNKTTLRFLALAAAAALSGVSPLAAQFHEYVALGDSLTAGVEGGCLVQRNQVNSYPAVIARQIGITDFEQPLVQELGVTNPLVGTPCLGAVFAGGTVTVGTISQMGPPLNLALARPYDNLGMPGAAAADLVDLRHGNPAGSTAEQSAALVLRNVSGSPFDGMNAVEEANLLSPDLVSLWIGNNDVLGAALTGVFADGVTVTPLDVFTLKYGQVVTALAVSGRTLIVANIPDVTAIPFTTTIPPVLVDPTTRVPVTVGGQLVPLLGEGDAQFPCTPTPPDQGCPLPAGTLVTLPASALLAQGFGIPVAAGGTGRPLPNGSVSSLGLMMGVTLYPDEVSAIQTRTDAMNTAIASAVSAAGGFLVDIHSIFNQIAAEGFTLGGITLSRTFLTGGIFSGDGFHASSIGYTIVADEFIKALNAGAGTHVPEPDFSAILFSPNTPPPPVSGTERGAGPWGYSLGNWQTLFSSASGRPSEFHMPELAAPPDRQARTPRLVIRG